MSENYKLTIMGELSIKEKAQRYDEALERVKSKIKNDKDHVLYEDDIIELFPEIAESEDEKIELLNYLYDVHDDDEERARWIAWLEKQGEYKAGRWSEEDELHIKELESLVKQEWAKAERENDRDKIHKMSDLSFFLKTLKPQPKQELSEGDKRIIDNLISQLGNLYARKLIKEETKDKYVNWLKSLMPQNRWKPSGFHLECISDAIAIYEERGINAIGLKEILEELKKLREEDV